MKKMLAMLLAMTMCISITACGNKPEDNKLDEVIVDNEYVLVTITEKYEKVVYDKPQIGYVMLAENKTDKNISITFDDVSIDGFVVDEYVSTGGSTGSWQEVPAGKNVYFNWYFASENVVDSVDDLKNVSADVCISELVSQDGNSAKYREVDTVAINLN